MKEKPNLKNINLEEVYTIEKHKKTTSIENFLKYIKIPKVEEYCKQCDNYAVKWDCPPHKENPLCIWKKYENATLYLLKLNYAPFFQKIKFTEYELRHIVKHTVYKERTKQSKELLKIEKETNGFLMLGGSCILCKKCTRTENLPCKFPEKRKNSPESLGAHLIKATEDLFNIKLKWSQNYQIPEYITNISIILH